MANSVRIVARMDDQVSGPLAKMRDKFDTLGKNKGFQAVAQGVGLGLGISAWGLVDRAISEVVNIAGDSVKAFNEDQASIAQLNTSLKANVAGWDGNRTAIEEVLKARVKLGFSDDEQRTSLSLLVAATHDVNKALEIEATAMDLARFKHITLADATEALTRVEAGSYRILKSLGIELPKNATQTQALAAVQAVAAGQAADYAQTNEGKLLVSQVKVREAEEKFGKTLADLAANVMPPLADAVTVLAEGFVTVEDNVAALIKQLNDYAGSAHAAGDNTDWLGSKTDPLGKALHNIVDGVGAFLTERDRVIAAVPGMADAWATGAADMTTTNDHFQTSFQDTAAAVENAIKASVAVATKEVKYLPLAMAGALSDGWDAVHTAATALGEALKNPIKAAAREKELTEILTGKGTVGKMLARGLASDDPIAVEKAKKLFKDTIAELDAFRHFKITISTQTTYTGGHGGGTPHTSTPAPSTTTDGGAHRPSIGGLPQVNVIVDGEQIRTRIIDSLMYSRENQTFVPA
jgi:hypothetical protein